MKKLLIVFALFLLIDITVSSCGSAKEEAPVAADSTVVVKDTTVKVDTAKVDTAKKVEVKK